MFTIERNYYPRYNFYRTNKILTFYNTTFFTIILFSDKIISLRCFMCRQLVLQNKTRKYSPMSLRNAQDGSCESQRVRHVLFWANVFGSDSKVQPAEEREMKDRPKEKKRDQEEPKERSRDLGGAMHLYKQTVPKSKYFVVMQEFTTL